MRMHQRHIRKYIILGIFGLIAGCIEPFEPDIDRYENVLVVDGTLTNEDEDLFVRLSRTFGYYDLEELMVIGAVVAVMDDEGNSAIYDEISPGLYKLDKGIMPGIVGRSYKLMIETADEKVYESDFEILKKPVEIDSVFYEVREDIGTLGKVDGVQLYLNSKDEESETHYYRWDWTETWEFFVPYQKPGYESKRICWKENISSNITIANTLQLVEDYNYKQKLNFVSTAGNKLLKLYSTNVRQYSLTAKAYDFWRKLELANEHTGSLFDPPPTPVIGNMQNVDDPYEPVLGYFQVSGVSQKRIFISREELPPTMDLTTGNEHCSSMQVIGEGLTELQTGWYLLFRFTWMDTIHTSMSSHVDCYDCTMNGDNLKPDFWIDLDELE